jgi:hypothetical protein
LPQETTCISRLLLILKDYLDLLIKIDALKLAIAGHEYVFPVNLEVFRLALGPRDTLLL